MAYECDSFDVPLSRPGTSGWTNKFKSWLRGWRKSTSRKKEVYQLLSGHERWLEDVGLTRSQLVHELGYDPRELPSVSGRAMYRFPQMYANSSIRKNHPKTH